MTQQELYQGLSEIGLPIAYHHFGEPTTLPYLVYLFSYSSDLFADGKNYKTISNFQIELYSNKKDLDSEQKVENKLQDLGLPYFKTETWIETEELYQTLYEVRIL